MEKQYRRAGLFEDYIKEKKWPEAKHCYDTVLTVLCEAEAEPEIMLEFFGERGERGKILKEGLFKEELVQKAYYEAAVKRDGGYENKKYRPWQQEKDACMSGTA